MSPGRIGHEMDDEGREYVRHSRTSEIEATADAEDREDCETRGAFSLEQQIKIKVQTVSSCA